MSGPAVISQSADPLRAQSSPSIWGPASNSEKRSLPLGSMSSLTITPASAPNTPDVTLLEELTNLRTNERYLASDLSILHGEFTIEGLPADLKYQYDTAINDAGFAALDLFDAIDRQITFEITRIKARVQGLGTLAYGSQSTQSLAAERDEDRSLLEEGWKAHNSKKRALTDLRVKLESVFHVKGFSIHRYEVDAHFCLIGNQVIPKEYKRGKGAKLPKFSPAEITDQQDQSPLATKEVGYNSSNSIGNAPSKKRRLESSCQSPDTPVAYHQQVNANIASLEEKEGLLLVQIQEKTETLQLLSSIESLRSKEALLQTLVEKKTNIIEALEQREALLRKEVTTVEYAIKAKMEQLSVLEKPL